MNMRIAETAGNTGGARVVALLRGGRTLGPPTGRYYSLWVAACNSLGAWWRAGWVSLISLEGGARQFTAVLPDHSQRVGTIQFTVGDALVLGYGEPVSAVLECGVRTAPVAAR